MSSDARHSDALGIRQPVPRLRLLDTAAAPASNTVPARRWVNRYRLLLEVADATVIVAAVAMTVLLRLEPTQIFSLGIAGVLVPLFIGAGWYGLLGVFRSRDEHVLAVGAAEYKRVVNATAVAFGLLAIVIVLFPISPSRGYFLIALPVGIAGLLLGRWSCRRWLLVQRGKGRFLSRAVVVGHSTEALQLLDQLADASTAGFDVVGVVIDDAEPPTISLPDSITVTHGLEQAATVAARAHADSVIVTGGSTADPLFIRNLGWSLEGTATELVLSSRLTDVAGPRIHFRPVTGLPLLHVEIPTFDGWRHTVKRSFDVTLAAIALLLLAPLMAVIAICIRLDSPGPVLFRQERCGRNGQTFAMLKFRSMRADAEQQLTALLDRDEGNGVMFKLHDDPRVTRVGHILRKHSLDELPQFWNVLIGQMSIVGPRPPLPREVARYDGDAQRRLYIKPGVTGLWQVNGRSNLTWEESVRLDLYYVENWSLTGDLMLIWRTAKVVIWPEGAY